jgi:hypothetical protein
MSLYLECEFQRVYGRYRNSEVNCPLFTFSCFIAVLGNAVLFARLFTRFENKIRGMRVNTEQVGDLHYTKYISENNKCIAIKSGAAVPHRSISSKYIFVFAGPAVPYEVCQARTEHRIHSTERTAHWELQIMLGKCLDISNV